MQIHLAVPATEVRWEYSKGHGYTSTIVEFISAYISVSEPEDVIHINQQILIIGWSKSMYLNTLSGLCSWMCMYH
ncbi:unnamed protein product, partial [Musa acuminata var. zebrina]